MLIRADKTTNFCRMRKKTYQELMKRQVTEDYKKADPHTTNYIDQEVREIVTKLDIQDRVPQIIKEEAFITLKDHKQNFLSKPTCRLINSTKPVIGKISKYLLENINKEVRRKKPK